MSQITPDRVHVPSASARFLPQWRSQPRVGPLPEQRSSPELRFANIQDIEDRGDAPVPDVGTMYRALARMVEAGLIRAAARRPAPDASDERRNYYRITEAGHLVAIAEARRLEAPTRAARLGGLLPKATKS